jgi:hypothetical protein
MFQDYRIKILFIIIIFSLFISGCELIEEREPQFRNSYNVMEIATYVDTGSSIGGSKGGNKEGLNSPSCTDFNGNLPGWFGSCNPGTTYDTLIYCGFPLIGDQCSSCYVESTSIYCNNEELNGCYCIGDGICNDGIAAPDYGESTSSSDCNLPTHNICNGNTCIVEEGEGVDECENVGSIDPMCVGDTHLDCNSGQCMEVEGIGLDLCSIDMDCRDCNPGVTSYCNLPQIPGTCGECNLGIKTCNGIGQWGACQQITNPIDEICDNNLDDDCDCIFDNIDQDCFFTHLDCVNDQCIEVEGQGPKQCNIDNDCIYYDHSECLDQMCVTSPGFGIDECTNDVDCGAVAVGICGDEVRNRIDPYTGEIEQCDWPDLGGETCISQGYSSGTLGCTNSCYFDTSECI